MNLSFLKQYRSLLITVGIVVLIVLVVPWLGMWATETYLVHAMYPENPDPGLIVYEQGMQNLAGHRWGFLAQPFMVLQDKLDPHFFLHVHDFTLEGQQEGFDYTQQPATFNVTGTSATQGNLMLSMQIPTLSKGQVFDSQIACSQTYTTISEPLYDASTTLKMITTKDGLIDVSKMASVFKTYPITKPVYVMLVDLLNRSDIKAGSKKIVLNAQCDTYGCGFVGPKCDVSIVNAR